MKSLNQRFSSIFFLILIMFIVQIINALTDYSLVRYGLLPRRLSGLSGILFAPFLHSSWSHFINNMLVFVPLSALILWSSSTQKYWLASGFIIILGGLTQWILARSAYHVGASGWIFGLWALILVNGIFNRSMINIICAIVVFFYFGSMWVGLLPEKGISFEGHIFGALWGGIFAWKARQYDRYWGKRMPPTRR